MRLIDLHVAPVMELVERNIFMGCYPHPKGGGTGTEKIPL